MLQTSRTRPKGCALDEANCTKTCTTCGLAFPATLDFFHKQQRGKYGLRPTCKSCTIANNKRYDSRTPEQIREYQRQYAHTQRRRETQLAWRQANPDRWYSYYAKWAKNNPHATRAQRHVRRARLRGATGVFAAEDVARLLVEQCSCCYLCGAMMAAYTVDHIVPLSRGGSNGPENIALACFSCNSRKWAKTLDELS